MPRCNFDCEYAKNYTQKVIRVFDYPHWVLDKILCYRSGDVESVEYLHECPYFKPTELAKLKEIERKKYGVYL